MFLSIVYCFLLVCFVFGSSVYTTASRLFVFRYFSLVVALNAHTTEEESYTVLAHVSERIIVRVSDCAAVQLFTVHVVVCYNL